MSTKIELMDGKYTLEHNNGVGLRCLRYGEYWRDLVGDGMVLALVSEVEDLREKLAKRDAGKETSLEAFEAWVKSEYICAPDSLFKVPAPDGFMYVYDVCAKSISGQVSDEKCSVQMLWESWKASRGAA